MKNKQLSYLETAIKLFGVNSIEDVNYCINYLVATKRTYESPIKNIENKKSVLKKISKSIKALKGMKKVLEHKEKCK